MNLRQWLLALTLLVFAASANIASAHKPSDSYLRLELDGKQLSGQWDIALRDLDLALGLDRNEDSALDWGEVRSRQPEIERYALNHLALAGDGATCSLSARDLLIDRHTDGAYAVLMLEGACPGVPASLQVSYSLLFELDAQHRGLLRLERAGDASATLSAVFPKDRPVQRFDAGRPSRWRTWGGFVADGIRHIAIGYDHILFLVALLLPAVLRRRDGRWAPVESLRECTSVVAATVTAFTVAHSITLSLATLGWVSLPSRLVESAIALSVLLTAIDNLVPFLPRRRWQVAFVFGLLHGFGFASVLRDLDLPRAQLALSLFGFNVGVEFGQLALVALLLPAAWLLRRRPIYWRFALGTGSLAIALVATLWLLERSLDLKLMPA